MDAVYICRSGENEELRYSLRSLVNVPHDRVWIFGDAPCWYSGDLVSVPQVGGKQANNLAALMAACSHPDVSDPFLYFNDDFYCLGPWEITLYDRGTIAEVLAFERGYRRDSGYIRAMAETEQLLIAEGITEPRCFENHAPIPVRKALMLDVLRDLPRCGLHYRTIYGNRLGEPSVTLADNKLLDGEDLRLDSPWLSTSDRSFHTASTALAALFPEPSPYERRTAMYTSPRRVERNGVLIAFAGEVMTETEAIARGLLRPEPVEKPRPSKPAPTKRSKKK